MGTKLSLKKTPVIKSVLKENPQNLRKALSSYYPSLDSNKIGQHAIVIAVSNESVDILKILLESGITFNINTSNSLNPLNIAIKNGSKEIVLVLINSMTDQNNLHKPDPERIWNTFSSDKSLLSKRLHQHINDYPVKNKQSDFNQAVQDGSQDAINDYLSNGADPNQRDSNGSTALINAINSGDNEMAELLLDSGADYSLPDFNYKSPLMHAVENNNKKIIILLIEFGADPHQKGMDNKSAFLIAKENGLENIFANIQNASTKTEIEPINSSNQSIQARKQEKLAPSDDAIRQAHPRASKSKKVASEPLNSLPMSSKSKPDSDYQKLKNQLLNGKNPNSVNSSGQTPLMAAMKSNNPHIILLLIKHGAKINLKDVDGNSALMIAAINNSDKAIKALHKKGASIETRNIYGITPLMLASMNKKEKAVKMLLKLGANVDSKNKNGQTALMFASFYNHDDIIKLLLSAKADKQLVDIYGRNALSLAYYRKNAEAINLLK